MSLVVYSLKPGVSGGNLSLPGGTEFDVGAAITAGGGTITVDDQASPALVDALDHSGIVVRTGGTPSTPISQDIIGPIYAHLAAGGQVGDILLRGNDGLFSAQQPGGANGLAKVGSDGTIFGPNGSPANPAMLGTVNNLAAFWQPNHAYKRGDVILDHLAIMLSTGPQYRLRICTIDHVSPAVLNPTYPWGNDGTNSGVQWVLASTNGTFRGPFEQSIPSQLAAINNQLGILAILAGPPYLAGSTPLTALSLDATAFPNPPGTFQAYFAQAITLAYASGAIPVSQNFAIASQPNVTIGGQIISLPIAPAALRALGTLGAAIALNATVIYATLTNPLTEDVYAGEILAITNTAGTVQTFTVGATLRASVSQAQALANRVTNQVWNLIQTGAPTAGTFSIVVPTANNGTVTATGIAQAATANAIATAVQSALVAAGASGATVTGTGGPISTAPVQLTINGVTVTGAITSTSSLTGGASPAVVPTALTLIQLTPTSGTTATALMQAGSPITISFPAGSTISLHSFYGSANPQYTPEDIIISPTGSFIRALYSDSGNNTGTGGSYDGTRWASIGYRALINQTSPDVAHPIIGQPDMDLAVIPAAVTRSRIHVPRTKPAKIFSTLADFDLGITGNIAVTSICGQHEEPAKNAGTPKLYYGVTAAWTQVADISHAYVRMYLRVPGQGSAAGQPRASITHTYLEATSDPSRNFNTNRVQFDLVPGSDNHLPEDVYAYAGCGPTDWVPVVGTTDLTSITAMRLVTSASNNNQWLAPDRLDLIPVNGQTINIGGKSVASLGDGRAKICIRCDDSDPSTYTALADQMNAYGWGGTVAAGGAITTGGNNPTSLTPLQHRNLRRMGWQFLVHYFYPNDGDDPWCKQPPVLQRWFARAKAGLQAAGVYGVDDTAWHDTWHMTRANYWIVWTYFRSALRYGIQDPLIETLPPMEPYSVHGYGISGADINSLIDTLAGGTINSGAAIPNPLQVQTRLNFNLAAGSPIRLSKGASAQILTVAGATGWQATQIPLTAPGNANAQYTSGNSFIQPGLGLLSGSALSTVANTSSLNIAPFYQVYAGERITLVNGANSQTWTASADVAPGAGPIPVVPQLATFAFPGDGTTFAYWPGATLWGMIDVAIAQAGMFQPIYDPSVTAAEADVVTNMLIKCDKVRSQADVVPWAEAIQPWLVPA